MQTGTIYIITNDINKKVYIGQTINDLETRFKQHIKKSTISSRHYKLQNALKKYGKEHFKIAPLEENVPFEKLNERETYYIEKYNSLKLGYNSTSGGDGRIIYSTYDEDYIVNEYKKSRSMKMLANKFNVSTATISRVLKRKGVDARPDGRKYDCFGKEIINLWNNGTRIKDIAIKFNVNEKTIRRHIKRLGLKSRGSGCAMCKRKSK